MVFIDTGEVVCRSRDDLRQIWVEFVVRFGFGRQSCGFVGSAVRYNLAK
jgi:hypothetical protein